ncbi:MAG: DUF484 family protein [Nitrospinae bacterium]|nr:DUF484 family protein [Nitrospinota bacterium]
MMNKDQIAIYLNEHPEFFNEYPELLAKIHAIQPGDLPLEPLNALSVADRIIKRVHADKEHLKSKLDWFLEIAQKNEEILAHLCEIERLIFSSVNLPQMILRLKEEIVSRFEINSVWVCLVDDTEHLIENKLRERFEGELGGNLKFIDKQTVKRWFPDGPRPILRAEIPQGSEVFSGPECRERVKSEAWFPIVIRGGIVGTLALGSEKPYHFYEGLRTEYLERLTDKLALAIDNILLLDLLKRQSALDRETGLYNEVFLDPVLLREFDRAQRYGKPLSCVKMRIDYFDRLADTIEEELKIQLRKEAGKILKLNCRTSDMLVRSGEDEFVLLLPEIDRDGAFLVAERIRSSLEIFRPLDEGPRGDIKATLGIATYPADSVNSHKELLEAAGKGLARALEDGNNQVAAA